MLQPLALPPELSVRQALERVLRLPAVASKRYLTNKVLLAARLAAQLSALFSVMHLVPLPRWGSLGSGNGGWGGEQAILDSLLSLLSTFCVLACSSEHSQPPLTLAFFLFASASIGGSLCGWPRGPTAVCRAPADPSG